MANNLIASYDLDKPNRDYKAVISAIQSLGLWVKLHKSVWYIKSDYSAEQAREMIGRAADPGDKVLVVDATNNVIAWDELSDSIESSLNQLWPRP